METETAYVSVIMGVHNSEPTLRSALESIQKQTFTDWEYIICDDGSTDATWDVLKETAAVDPRLKLLRNSTNRGLAYTLNRCIDAASGRYLARQDADDTSDRKRLGELAAYLDTHPAVAVVGTYAALVDDQGKFWGELRHPLNPEKLDWLKGPCVVHPSVMMRKKAIIEAGKYDEHAIRLEDYELWLRLVGGGHKIVNIPEDLYNLHWDRSDYSRRRFKYRFGEMRLVLRALNSLNAPPSCYGYLLKPLFAGLLPKRLLFQHHVRKFGHR
ncbi:MAG TPA: glycosyltransferase family 2 protein [Syntrophorhabdales bacterium]|nr:glycosyltransferase family 2 protein [Syntrophorhabdales bacterium]